MSNFEYPNRPVGGTDALGRTIPSPEKFSTRRDNRTVGLFYFLWLCEGNKRLFNVSKITDSDPEAGFKVDDPMWGGIGEMHYWGEPFYGYYAMTDEWVVRRHMKLIMEADIDFLFFDTTNAVVYENICHIVMRVLQEYAKDGFKIPKVMFYTNTLSGKTVRRIYDEFYKPGLYKETWFEIGGKPVIIAIPEECDEETKAFFTIKLAQWPNEPTKRGGWPWMDFEKPQRVFENLDGVPESINVSVAQHPQIRFGDSVMYGETTNCGRAWHKGANDTEPYAYTKCYNFIEQFERALETDPPIVLVTGWNEWIAGRWQGPEDRPLMFVDCANYEFSRDIEMMRGGYFDNYFMSLISYVRKYKGTDGVPATKPGETAVFKGFRDGAMIRDCDGWTTRQHYHNETMRCSIESVSVTHDGNDITFEITADRIPEKTGAFFNVFIATGTRPGYDYVANYYDREVARIIRPLPDGTPFRPCDDLSYTVPAGKNTLDVTGNTVKISFPLSLIGMENGGEILFKVCDASVQYETVDDFYDKGDVLPMGRPGFILRLEP